MVEQLQRAYTSLDGVNVIVPIPTVTREKGKLKGRRLVDIAGSDFILTGRYLIMVRPGSGKRELILEVASHMLWTGSYGAISADRVCEAAGVNKGVFYHYFKSKAHLTLEAIEYNWSQIAKLASETLTDASISPEARILRFVAQILATQKMIKKQSGKVPGCPFGNLAVELRGTSREIDSRLEEIFSRHRQILRPVVAEIEGISPGDVDFVVMKLITYLEGIWVMAKAYNDIALAERLIQEIPFQLKAGQNG